MQLGLGDLTDSLAHPYHAFLRGLGSDVGCAETNAPCNCFAASLANRVGSGTGCLSLLVPDLAGRGVWFCLKL
jgi:hypothetical protein